MGAQSDQREGDTAPREEERPDSKETNRSAPEREHSLRFVYLRGLSKPAGTIHLDQALDALGRTMFPGRWGRGHMFNRLPFFISDRWSSKGVVRKVAPRLVRTRLRRVGHAWVARRTAILTSAKSVELHRPTARMFTAAARTLRKAIEARELRGVRLLAADMSIQPIDGAISQREGDRNRLGLFAKQNQTAFCLGVVLEGPPGARTPSRILFEQGLFEHWLATRAVPENGALPIAGKQTPGAALATAAAVMERVAKRFGGPLSMDDTRQVLEDVLKEIGLPPSSQNRFKEKVWDAPAFKAYRASVRVERGHGTGGRRREDGKDADARHRTLLREELLAEIGRRPPVSTKLSDPESKAT